MDCLGNRTVLPIGQVNINLKMAVNQCRVQNYKTIKHSRTAAFYCFVIVHHLELPSVEPNKRTTVAVSRQGPSRPLERGWSVAEAEWQHIKLKEPILGTESSLLLVLLLQLNLPVPTHHVERAEPLGPS